jgi:hypothetical protein
VEGGKITFSPKGVIDRNLAEGLEDLRAVGRMDRTLPPRKQSPHWNHALRNTSRKGVENPVYGESDKDYGGLPPSFHKAFARQTRLLANQPACEDTRPRENLWQARVDRNWRFYFKIDGDEYAIFGIVPRPKFRFYLRLST